MNLYALSCLRMDRSRLRLVRPFLMMMTAILASSTGFAQQASLVQREEQPGQATALEPDIRQAPKPVRGSDLGVGRRVSDFEFQDWTGKKRRLSEYADGDVLVVAMTGTGCPLCLKYAPTLAALEQRLAGQGVKFLFINPNESENDARVQAAIDQHGFRGAYVRDNEETISQTLGVLTTTETFVLDAARTLVYRGAVDDQYGLGYSLDHPRTHYLLDAVSAVLRGEQPRIEATTAPGCEMFYEHELTEQPIREITFHNQISRILQSHCQQCHRDQGSAPFSLSSYQDAKDYAGMIANVVRRRVMPPWFAADGQPTDGQIPIHWANDRSLPDLDREALIAWVKGGVPEGDPADAPLPRQYHDQWSIGSPDLIVQLPAPIAVKATGQMPYQNRRVETKLTEDRWIQAVEIKPTNASVVHHVLVYALKPGEQEKVDEDAGFFAAYVPGNTHQQYPPGFAKRLPAGSTLVFQMHYTPNGTATEDQTKLAVKFVKDPPERMIRNVGISNHKIKIPPHADNHRESALLTVPQDVQLLGFFPHMHLRGKAFRYEITFPDGRHQRILDVPHYDFNWQLEYRLSEPLAVPKGSRIEVTGWFDNSNQNPANPNPNETVGWGPQTDDEMLLGYVEYFVSSEQAHQLGDAPESNSDSAANTKNDRFWKNAFRRADRNGDDRVTPDEFDRRGIFRRLDLNGDNTLTLDEVLKAGPSL